MSNREIVGELLANNKLLWDLRFNVSDDNGHREELLALIARQRDKNALLANRLDAQPRRDKVRVGTQPGQPKPKSKYNLAEDAIRRGTAKT